MDAVVGMRLLARVSMVVGIDITFLNLFCREGYLNDRTIGFSQHGSFPNRLSYLVSRVSWFGPYWVVNSRHKYERKPIPMDSTPITFHRMAQVQWKLLFDLENALYISNFKNSSAEQQTFVTFENITQQLRHGTSLSAHTSGNFLHTLLLTFLCFCCCSIRG